MTLKRTYLVVMCVSACATAPATDDQHTIEPGTGNTTMPASGAGAGATPAKPAGEGDFVLSRESTSASKPAADANTLHIGEKWWTFRAEHLKVREADVKERDAAISERQAPANFWDKQTATETVAIWGSLCNECHGGRRRLKDALSMPPPPAGWGRGDGLFFGNRRDYAAVFATVNLGGPERNGKRSQMPPWIGKLAKEQMWALLYFLEFQSGGIEGKFPPSLYPRPLQER